MLKLLFFSNISIIIIDFECNIRNCKFDLDKIFQHIYVFNNNYYFDRIY